MRYVIDNVSCNGKLILFLFIFLYLYHMCRYKDGGLVTLRCSDNEVV